MSFSRKQPTSYHGISLKVTVIDEKQENVKKLFIVFKNEITPTEENRRLLKDLTMFADKTIDIG